MNVLYQGKRTTARFPADVWEMYVAAVGSEDDASSMIRETLADAPDTSLTASEAARAFIAGYVVRSLSGSGSQLNMPLSR